MPSRPDRLASHLAPATPRELAIRGRARLHASTAETRPARAFGYVRVSSDEQATEGQSLQVQEQQLRGWAMQHSRDLAEVYVEPGVSGGTPFNERPEGGKLWQLVQSGDTVVASKLDRMFRSVSDCLAVVEAFKARGVSLYLLDLNGGADDVSGNGIARLFLTIVSAFAEFERDRIGERIRATKRAQKARGEWSGGTAPFGWRATGKAGDQDRKLVPIPEEQEALERIREMNTAGASSRKISAELATMGFKLSHVSVQKILSRENGTYETQGE